MDNRDRAITDYATTIKEDGFALAPSILPEAAVHHLRQAVASIPNRVEVRRKRGVYGVRNLLEICPAVRGLAGEPRIRDYVTPVLGKNSFAVRAVFFDKIPDANWGLGWHQDSVISVADRRDAAGFVGWSRKADVWQVQPPVEVLAGMLAVRVHLDDCGSDNGPLRVIPGSHRHGWLDDDIEEWKQRGERICEINCGGLVIMRPLLLHASSPAESARHRRVIHLEYASETLPGGLQWNNRIGAGEASLLASTGQGSLK